MLHFPWLDSLKSTSPPRPGRPRLALESLEDRCLPAADVVLQWNQVLLDSFKADRLSPMFFGREAAIVHAAIYDAVNAIDRSHAPFHAHIKAPRGASIEAAVAQAAHDTLAALFPSHLATFDATLAADLAGIPAGRARLGVAVGHAAAQDILDWRRTDGSDAVVNYTPGTAPGDWQPTPPTFGAAQGPQWGHVTPFCIPSDSAFRAPKEPELNSAEYTAAFDEVKSIGSASSTTRTADQSEIAKFWYGAVGTFTAGGYWNQIAQGIAQQRGQSLVQNARLFALLNLSLADAQFAIWDTKYTYNFWRPVTAIRAADIDGNDDTVADSTWAPFLNTPAHPSYSSGHSGQSGAAAAVLAAYFGTDAIPFSFSSDSLPGVTRSYASLSAALQECSDSRVYAGIYWRFDVQVGQTTGRQVGDYVVTHWLLPVPTDDDEGGAAAPVPSATGAVISPSLSPQGAADGMSQVGRILVSPAGTVSPVTPAAPAGATGSSPFGAPADAKAVSLPPRALKRAGAASDFGGLLDDLPFGAVFTLAW